MAIPAGSRRARTGSGDGLTMRTRPGMPVSLGVRPPAPGVVMVGGGRGGVSEGWNRGQFEHVGEHRRNELFEG